MHGAAKQAFEWAMYYEMEWIIYLGDDVLVTSGALSNMIHFLTQNDLKTVGLVQFPYWNAHDLMGMAALIARAHITPKTARWFQFPFNFDPCWGPDDCPNRSDVADAAKIAPANPLADLLSLLGGRR